MPKIGISRRKRSVAATSFGGLSLMMRRRRLAPAFSQVAMSPARMLVVAGAAHLSIAVWLRDPIAFLQYF
jgi:hypothetical protein